MTRDGSDDPWFVGMDVAAVLGFSRDNYKYHLKANIQTDEKVILGKRESSQTTLSLFPGRATWVSLISESGLYKLIMRSDKPAAKAFQDWVTREVLPSIRKTGAYVTGQPSAKDVDDPLDLMMSQAELLPKLIAQMKEQRAAYHL